MSTSTIRFVDPEGDKTIFFTTLRKRVDAYFKDSNQSKHYNLEMLIKTAILVSAYVLPYIFMVVFRPSVPVSMLLWSVMGLAVAGIGMSVMHDANHGAYSNNQNINFWLGHTLNLVGGSVFNWKMQHNLLHHTYTNIVHLDDDIDDKPALRFSPHTEVKWYHRLQYIHAFFLYGITTLYWVLVKDFVQFDRYQKEGVNKQTKAENSSTFLKLFAVKAFYLGVVLALPIFVLHINAGWWILGFVLMHVITGFVLTLIFQLAHTVEGTQHPLPNEQHIIPTTWAIHQLNTTVNFARNNRLLSWYIGGLNFQIEHHLFPTICHVHYPAVSNIVKATCAEYNVPYMENESFLDAIRSHVRTLERFGKLPKLSEAIV